MTKPVVVLGGGCAGLSAALRLQDLGLPVMVAEAREQVGGLAGGMVCGGLHFDFGPHVFHASDPEVFEQVSAVMGSDLKPFRRTIKIRYLDRYFAFPLSPKEILSRLPPSTLLRAAGSLAWHAARSPLARRGAETAESVLRRRYGDVLYRLFFKDYLERVWGLPPAGLSPALARQRLSGLSLGRAVRSTGRRLAQRLGVPARRPAHDGFVETTAGGLFAVPQGFSLIARRMAERIEARGGAIRLAAPVRAILHDGRKASAVELDTDGGRERLDCRAVLSTLPINDAARAFSPALGSEVLRSADRLRFRAIVFVGIKVRRPRVLPSSFMYFREHSFNRVMDLSHFGRTDLPEGSTLLVTETTCDPGDRAWTDDAWIQKAVVSDLRAVDLLSPDEIDEIHVFRARHGYPVYQLGYEEPLKVLLDSFEGFSNVETAGRQGRFQYVNSHLAMAMGRAAADRLAGRLGRR